MAQFKQQYFFSWIITYISAAAVCVSCQELTSTLHDGNIACQGKEVVFTCTIEGSATLNTLILAWSSTEYIGRGDPLRFTTEDMRGMNRMSSIKGNVTAILTKNDMNAETRVLESELHIVADQASIVTCSSISASGAESIMFNVSDVPEAPLHVGATEISRLSESVCEIVVNWDPPANDIARYLVYIISSQGNIMREMLIDTTPSLIDSLILTGCHDNNDIGIKVAAINSVDCVGSNSTEVQLERLNVSTATLQESSQVGVGAAVGITLGVILPILFILGIALVVFIVYYMYVRRKERRDFQRSTGGTDGVPLLSQVTQLRETQQEQEQRVNQLVSQLSSEQNKLEALKEQQTNMTEEMTQLERKNRVTKLEGQVTQLHSDMSSTQEELKALKQQPEMEQVTQLEEHVTELENQLSSTMKELEALKQEQTKVSNSKDIQEERVTQLEEHMTKLENKLSSTRKELKALKQERTEIKSKLNKDLQESSRFTIPSASHQPGITVHSHVDSSARPLTRIPHQF